MEQIFYWRKHPNLHGWMERLYEAKGGSADKFNCVPVRLDAADIDALEQTIKAKALPETAGFVFGESDGSETEENLHFVRKARDALTAGKRVFYTSWW
jgi:hypothetical protein